MRVENLYTLKIRNFGISTRWNSEAWVGAGEGSGVPAASSRAQMPPYEVTRTMYRPHEQAEAEAWWMRPTVLVEAERQADWTTSPGR